MKYQEWQLGCAFAWTFPFYSSVCATPYLGLTFGHVIVDMGDARQTIVDSDQNRYTANLQSLESQKDLGYAVGVTISGCKRLSFSLESRFASQKTFNFNVEVAF